MQKVNWDTYKFRCHMLPELMTNSRSKSDPLSETTKSKLSEIWIEEVYGRKNYDTKNKYTEKGIECESDSLTLIEQVTGNVYFKNKLELENDFIKGTPDVKTPLIDVKTAWNIFTFKDVDEKKALKRYCYQLLGYMWLTESDKGSLAFTLINTPEHIMYDELRLKAYKYPEIDQSEEVMEQFKKNYIFDDIPAEQRLKIFEVARNDEDIAEIEKRVTLWREFLKEQSL